MVNMRCWITTRAADGAVDGGLVHANAEWLHVRLLSDWTWSLPIDSVLRWS